MFFHIFKQTIEISIEELFHEDDLKQSDSKGVCKSKKNHVHSKETVI